jgi:hypothetical protein
VIIINNCYFSLLDNNLKLSKLIFSNFFVTKSKGRCAFSWPTASTIILKPNIEGVSRNFPRSTPNLCNSIVNSHKMVDTKIQGVSGIGTLILTGNRTRQKEQLFYLSFCRKTMFNSKKNWRDFSLK